MFDDLPTSWHALTAVKQRQRVQVRTFLTMLRASFLRAAARILGVGRLQSKS